MPSLLHPCRGCGHSTMDECWSVSKGILSDQRKLCLECHDECIPRDQGRLRQPSRPGP